MAQYPSATAVDMAGRIVRQRPGLDRNLALNFLNDRMRTVLDRRPVWSDLLRPAVISIPEQYTSGTIAVATGQTTVTGTNTNWPVADVVNTICSEIVQAPTTMWVTPADMTGITRDTVLFVDATGSPEICAVQDILQGKILLAFQYAHPFNFTITSSSLSQRQLRLNSINPVFTVLAVTSPTTLTLDMAWGRQSETGLAYQIVLIYTTIVPGLKDILLCTDPFQQIQMRIHVSQEELALEDPNRTSSNSPCILADRGPNINGNMLYEIYPPQVTAYQLNALVHIQWPDMRLPSDRLPPFMNPSVVTYGALADAFSTPIPKGASGKDEFFNPTTAAKYEAMFEQGVIDLINADDSKYLQTYQWNYAQTFGASMGANWEQMHDMDAVTGNY